MVPLFFNSIVYFIYSGVLIVNFENISYLAQGEKHWNMCFIHQKTKKSKFNRLQIEVFFLSNIIPP